MPEPGPPEPARPGTLIAAGYDAWLQTASKYYSVGRRTGGGLTMSLPVDE